MFARAVLPSVFLRASQLGTPLPRVLMTLFSSSSVSAVAPTPSTSTPDSVFATALLDVPLPAGFPTPVEGLTPRICSLQSYKVSLQAGEKVSVCVCGHSATQPFCDNAHVRRQIRCHPTEFIAEETRVYGFCGCKLSTKMAITGRCDGTHRKLKTELLILEQKAKEETNK